jgi:hypothetical protein
MFESSQTRTASAAASALAEPFQPGMAATESAPRGPLPTSATQRGLDFAAVAKLLDLKGILQPPRFPVEEREFPEWRYQFESTMTLLQMDELMDAAATAPDLPKLNDMTTEQRQAARFLHALLVALTRGASKAEVLVKAARDKNGLAAWRSLIREFAPPTADRQTAVLGGLLNPQWDMDRPWYPQFLAWENHVADHSLETGMAMPDAIKAATVIRHAPENVQAFLQLCPAQVTDNYAKLKAAIRGFLQKTVVYDADGVQVVNSTLMQLSATPPEGHNNRKPSNNRRRKKSPPARTQPLPDARPQAPQRQRDAKGRFKATGLKVSTLSSMTSASSGKPPSQVPRSNAAGRAFEGVCYRCNKPGHRVSECRVILQSDEQLGDPPRETVGVLSEAQGQTSGVYRVLSVDDFAQ